MIDYESLLNKTVQEIKPSGIRKFFDIVSEMPDAISLGVGEPDFVTPWEIRDAAIKSIQKGYTAYSSNSGLLPLRNEICSYLKTAFDLQYSPSEVIVTIGASEAIDLALRTVVNSGDEVLVPDPSYVSYCPGIMLAGGVPKPVQTTMAQSFKLSADALEAAITPRSKAIILPYPNNPTGAVLNKSDLEALLPVILKHNLLIISDEIYAELTYGDKHISVASFPGFKERTILISGFSKAFAMTGWRVGYVCAPPEMLKQMLKIHQYTIMCAPTASQYGALRALTSAKENNFAAVSEMRDIYNMRRRFMLNELQAMGLETFEPHGAFYVFPMVSSTGLKGQEFAEKLLRTKKVAVVPGDAFGDSGADFVRCSYATSMMHLSEAVKRIKEFVSEL